MTFSIRLALLVFGAFMVQTSTAVAQSIVAHRGASHDAPENTLSAFRLAWDQNADAIEGDFFLTKDQEIVCIHDEKTKRTSGVEMNVTTATFDELRKLDVGQWKNARFAGEKIPTLTEVLATVPEKKKIYIEIKCGPEIVPHLIPVLKKSGVAPEQTIVISFNDKVIKATRQMIPEIKAFWLVGFRQNKQTQQYEPSVDSIFKTAIEIQTQGIDIQAQRDLVTAEFVKRLRSEKLEFHVWTVNDPADARHFQSLGVDSITTDRPQFLREQLKLN